MEFLQGRRKEGGPPSAATPPIANGRHRESFFVTVAVQTVVVVVVVRPSHDGGPLGGMATVTPVCASPTCGKTVGTYACTRWKLLGGADGTHDPRGGLVHDGREEA